MNREELEEKLGRLPRRSFAHLPTPLEPCPRLSAALMGPQIWVKRDDLTGLCFGGNKTRQRFAFDPARLQGTLAELCRGTRAGRIDADERTLFKAVGNALEDLAAAELVFEGVSRDTPS